jgi:hypothetical protein
MLPLIEEVTNLVRHGVKPADNVTALELREAMLGKFPVQGQLGVTELPYGFTGIGNRRINRVQVLAQRREPLVELV